MKATSLDLSGVVLLEPKIHGDDRGFFLETFNKRVYEEAGIVGDFVQDNHSLSREAYVVRGLHFQSPAHAQGKLVRVSRGSVLDVVVDIRVGSPTFGKHSSAKLTADNGHQLWVPKGFAHGFCTLEPDTEFLYKVTDYYAPECDRGLSFDDPALGIDWGIPSGVAPVLSDRDKKHPNLADLPQYFKFGENS